MDVAVPARRGGMAGVRMAGFRGRTESIFDLQMVPYPALTLLIDSGDAMLVDAADGEQRRGNVVVGLAPVGVRAGARETDALQIRLSPVVAHAVLGAASELGGAVVTLDRLWGRDAVRLQERLHATTSWDERFAIVHTLLARRYEAGRRVDPEVAYAWRRIMLSRGGIRVDHLAAETGWTRKRLWSRFRTQLGITPKRASQLVRFDRAAHRLAHGHSPAEVSAATGYADQSHLTRATRSFTGLTPTALATAPWLAVDDVAWS